MSTDQKTSGWLEFALTAAFKLCNITIYVSGAQEKIQTLYDMDEKAYFDSKWTLEAICNILDNAVKYTNEGSISLSVTAYEMFVRIDIKDSGIGIKEEELSKIFSRFYRSEDTKNMEGVGIGLYLSRQIISGEGGYIKVSSVYGQGSTFSVFLPRSA